MIQRKREGNWGRKRERQSNGKGNRITINETRYQGREKKEKKKPRLEKLSN